MLELSPRGLFEPVSWRKIRWRMAAATIINGNKKWKAKKRVRVAWSTENPPHTHWTRVFPM